MKIEGLAHTESVGVTECSSTLTSPPVFIKGAGTNFNGLN